MSATEIAVAAIGLLLGYWLVAFFLKSDGQNKPGVNEPAEPDDFFQPQTPAAQPPQPPQPWHEVLHTPEDASAEQIRTAYESARDQYHPDKVRELGSELQAFAQRKSAEIEAAYRVAMRTHGIDV